MRDDGWRVHKKGFYNSALRSIFCFFLLGVIGLPKLEVEFVVATLILLEDVRLR